MTLPVRPILSVLLLIGGFLCLAIGLVSFKQLQISAPETLPQNPIALTPTPPSLTTTPTLTLPQLEIKIVARNPGSTQIILANSQPIKTTGLSLRLKANQQLPGRVAPYTLEPKLIQAGWVTPVNTLTLTDQASFFDLAITSLEPGGTLLPVGQTLASLPIPVSQLTLDSALSRLIDDQSTTYELILAKP